MMTFPNTRWLTARSRWSSSGPRAARPIPGDVFYLHSRLLERAARVSEKYGNGSLDRFAHHRDPGRRRFRLHPHQRHFHHRRADLPGNRLVLPGRAPGYFGRPLGLARRLGRANQSHETGRRTASRATWPNSASWPPSPSSARIWTPRPRRRSSAASASSKFSNSRNTTPRRSKCRSPSCGPFRTGYMDDVAVERSRISRPNSPIF